MAQAAVEGGHERISPSITVNLKELQQIPTWQGRLEKLRKEYGSNDAVAILTSLAWIEGLGQLREQDPQNTRSQDPIAVNLQDANGETEVLFNAYIAGAGNQTVVFAPGSGLPNSTPYSLPQFQTAHVGDYDIYERKFPVTYVSRNYRFEDNSGNGNIRFVHDESYIEGLTPKKAEAYLQETLAKGQLQLVSTPTKNTNDKIWPYFKAVTITPEVWLPPKQNTTQVK